MHVSYEKFKSVTLGDMTEDEFARLAPMADVVIDHWTLGRVGREVSKGASLPDSVVIVYAAVVEALPAVLDGSKAGGGLVSSFSNGVDSYSFDVSETVEQQLSRTVGWMAHLLPVEWSSGVVSYEGGLE